MESPVATADTSVIGESPDAHVVTDIEVTDSVVTDSVVTDIVVTDSVAVTPAIEAELLIEEISIDGMCGVY